MTNQDLLEVLKEIRELSKPRREMGLHRTLNRLRDIWTKADSAIRQTGEVWQRQKEQ